MRLLLTNDDGIDADGLHALLNAVRGLGEPVVVAPAGPQSGVSHAVTTGSAVRVEPWGDGRFAVHLTVRQRRVQAVRRSGARREAGLF